MMFARNDGGGPRGFTRVLVPGSQKLAGWSLSCECHRIDGGEKRCLAAPISRSWGFMAAAWMREALATIYKTCVWMNEREREREREGGREGGWEKRKTQTNPLDASQGGGQAPPQGFLSPTRDGGAAKSPRPPPAPRAPRGKGISVKHTRGRANQKQAHRGHKGGRTKTINKSTQFYSVRRIAKVTPPRLNHLGECTAGDWVINPRGRADRHHSNGINANSSGVLGFCWIRTGWVERNFHLTPTWTAPPPPHPRAFPVAISNR